MFFGMGMPLEYQNDGYNGVMRPLARFQDKLSLIRRLDQTSNGHDGSSTQCFRGGDPKKTTIEQYILQDAYPNGAPTPIQSLSMGSHFRRRKNGSDAPGRYVKAWKDGRIVMRPIQSPIDLFNRLFAGANIVAPSVDGAPSVQGSILDGVLEQYATLMGPNSRLNELSKSQLSDHFERVRELERRLQTEGDPMLSCSTDEPPADTGVHVGPVQLHENAGTPVRVDQWEAHWDMMVDMYVLAMQCDQFRIGTTLFQAGGEQLKPTGDLMFEGEKIFTFDNEDIHDGFYHKYQQGGNDRVHDVFKAAIFFKMKMIGRLLEAFDNPNYLDANGKTLLDNMFMIISTELGNPAKHSAADIVNLVTGANGALKTGKFIDHNGATPDLYNTCLHGLGFKRNMGNLRRYSGDIAGLL